MRRARRQAARTVRRTIGFGYMVRATAWLWSTAALTAVVAYFVPEGATWPLVAGALILWGDGEWWLPVKDPRLAIPVSSVAFGLIFGAEVNGVAHATALAVSVAVVTKALRRWSRWVWWQSRLIIAKAWPELAEHAGWFDTKLLQVSRTRFGIAMRVRWPRGAVPPWATIPERVSSIIGRPVEQVEAHTPPGGHAGEVEIEVRSGGDPLAKPIIHPGMEVASANMVRIPVGINERGSVARLDWQHTLIAGQSGGGKSSAIQSILIAMWRLIAAGDVRLWIADPKEGTELGMWAPACEVFAMPLEMEDKTEAEAAAAELWVEFIRMVEGLMTERLVYVREHGKREWDASCGPVVVVVVDEAADVFVDEATKESAIRIAAKSRAAGVVFIVATQHPVKRVLDPLFVNNMIQTIGLSARSATQARVITGDNTARAPLHELPPPKRGNAGHAYINGSTGTWDRARCYWAKDALVLEAAKAARGDREAPALLVPPSCRNDAERPPGGCREPAALRPGNPRGSAENPVPHEDPMDVGERGRSRPASNPIRHPRVRPIAELAELVHSGSPRAGDIWDLLNVAGPEGVIPSQARAKLGKGDRPMAETTWTDHVGALVGAGLAERRSNGKRVRALYPSDASSFPTTYAESVNP